MITSLRKTSLHKASALLLLLALLSASLHVFAHLNDAGKSTQQTVIESSQHDSEPSGGSSLTNGHACLACQFLQHLKLNPAVAIVPDIRQAIVTDSRTLHFCSCAPTHSTSDRAPPLA